MGDGREEGVRTLRHLGGPGETRQLGDAVGVAQPGLSLRSLVLPVHPPPVLAEREPILLDLLLDQAGLLPVRRGVFVWPKVERILGPLGLSRAVGPVQQYPGNTTSARDVRVEQPPCKGRALQNSATKDIRRV